MSGAPATRRILLVTRNFPPLRGGMERLNLHLARALAEDADVTVCAPAGAREQAPELDVIEAPLKPLWRFLAVAALRCTGFALARRPRVVVAGSGVVAPIAWLAARLCGGRCVAYLHGLDVVVPHRAYRRLWLPFIRRCDLLLANSENTAALARAQGVPAGRLVVIHPGVDVPPSVPDAPRSAPVMVSVGRFTQRKGLAEFIEDALPAILRDVPGARLVVVGSEAVNALAGVPGQARRIAEATARAGVESAVEMRGDVSDAELAALFAQARVLVFPVREQPGDVEGFGMVAIEAAAHGVPTVAYAVGGVPEAIRDGESGDLVRPGDSAAFARAVIGRLRAAPDAATHEACRRHARAHAWPVFGEKVRAALRRIAP